MQGIWGIAAAGVVAAAIGAGAATVAQSGLRGEVERIGIAGDKQADEVRRLQAEIQKQRTLLAQARQEIELLAFAAETPFPDEERPHDPPRLRGAGGPAPATDDIAAGPASSAPAGGPVQAHVQQAVRQELERRDQERAKARQEEQQKRFAEMRDRRLERLTEAVGLNDYQKGEMRRIMERSGEKMRALWENARNQEDAGGDPDQIRDQRRAQFRTLREESNREAQAIMTPEQYQSYLKWQEENRGDFGGGGGGGFGGGRRGRGR